MLASGCRAADPTVFSAIDGSNIDRTIDGSDLYFPRFNSSRSCRDERLNAA